MILVKIIFKKQNFWALLASVTLGLNPFFLQNMSYKFDSPFMALALISPIIPFLFLFIIFYFYINIINYISSRKWYIYHNVNVYYSNYIDPKTSKE